MSEPLPVSVVVASHGRHLRLLWLLNALQEQTCTAWEVVIVHDYDLDTARRVLDAHPLAASGRLRHLAIEPGTGSPSRQRNLGWRAAAGELIAFTDDDCRPDTGWLAGLVAVAAATPGAIVQGATRPDPLEAANMRAPHFRTMFIEPPGPFAQTCNILYPRAVLQRLDGFDEQAISGEDVGLSLRARAIGHHLVGAPGAVVYHAVEAFSLIGILRENLKWRHLAYLVKRHPEVRADLTLRIFWDDEHLRTTAALVGLLACLRSPAWLALTAPYVRHATRRRGDGRRGRIVAAAEMPGRFTRQAAEVVGLGIGSARWRTLVL